MQAAGLALALALPLAARGDDLGRKVFTETAEPPCALCHTLQAAGAEGTIGPSLDELKPDRDRIVQAVRKGVGVMPPFADKLSEAEIQAVAAFVAKAVGNR
ncbi:MAG: c-type cytochrome [Burkholderiales bacterium]|nr:c-type cytochrome [Burkholderiales bacterium]